jgi:uncharacterized membrane protein
MKENNIEEENWQKDERNWKWGIFYYNPADPRIMPPKRIKQMGWTLNFAHKQAWFILLLILFIPLLCTIILRLF